MTPEHRFMSELSIWCGEHDFVCLRLNSGKAWNGRVVSTQNGVVVYDARPIELCPEGTSDILCIGKNGECYWIETKAPKGRQSAAQKRFQAMIEARGFKYILAKSMKDIDSILPTK